MNNTTEISAPLCSAFTVTNSYQAKVIKTVAFSLSMSLSLIGNILLVLVVFKHRKSGMMTTTNCLIVNMAISDLIIPCFAIPNKLYNLIEETDFRWLFGNWEGKILCKSLNFLLDVSTAVSIQCFVAIAVDRFYGVMFPLRAVRHRDSKSCKLVIPLIWLTSIALHSVYFYTFRLYTIGKQYYCILDWYPLADTKEAQMPFYMAQFCLLYACPLVIIACLYGCIIHRLRATTRNNSCNKSTRRKASENHRNRKVTKMCLIAVLAFAICWAPIHIYGLCFYFVWNWTVPCGIDELTFIVFFIAYLSAATNPFIFFTFNESFRRGLKRLLCCKNAKRRSQSQNSTSLRSRSTSGLGRLLETHCNNDSPAHERLTQSAV